MRISKYTQSKYSRCLFIGIPLFEQKMKANYQMFCGQPYIALSVWETYCKKTDTFILDMKLYVADEDDFDYTCEFEHPTPELIHEVINWMLDHEYATISDMNDVIEIVDAFQKRPVRKRKRH